MSDVSLASELGFFNIKVEISFLVVSAYFPNKFQEIV